jgi:transcriptional/translational regulatory protein YebC/TACO1
MRDINNYLIVFGWTWSLLHQRSTTLKASTLTIIPPTEVKSSSKDLGAMMKLFDAISEINTTAGDF